MKPKDSARRLVWWIVAGIAGALVTGVLASHREAGERSAAAAAALEEEEVRVARQTRERDFARQRETAEKIIRANDRALDIDRQRLEERKILSRAMKELRDSEFELEQAQKRAAR